MKIRKTNEFDNFNIISYLRIFLISIKLNFVIKDQFSESNKMIIMVYGIWKIIYVFNPINNYIILYISQNNLFTVILDFNNFSLYEFLILSSLLDWSKFPLREIVIL